MFFELGQLFRTYELDISTCVLGFIQVLNKMQKLLERNAH